ARTSMQRALPLSFFLCSSPLRRSLLSFPTRRSSDLVVRVHGARLRWGRRAERSGLRAVRQFGADSAGTAWTDAEGRAGSADRDRSEEHTSELQSRVDLVCRLLLEKKKPQPATTTARR